jgi:hypothetical protein
MTYPNQPGAGTPGGPPYRTPDAPPPPPDKPNASRFILPGLLLIVVLYCLYRIPVEIHANNVVGHPLPTWRVVITPLIILAICATVMVKFHPFRKPGNLA